MKTKLLLTAFALFVLLANVSISQTWIQQTSGITENLLAVQFLDANIGYACGDAGKVVKTTNGGSTWTQVNIGTTLPVNDISFTSATEGWAAVGDPNNASSTGEIWHTTNGGTTWTKQTPSTTEARFGIGFAPGSSTNGWAVGSRNGPINIDATTNGGTTWSQQSNSNIFGWLYKIKALSTSNAIVIGGAFFPTVSGFIIKTTNGGSTWTQPTTGTIPFMKGIDMADANNGCVVGDGGFIMTTSNGGTSWTTQTSGTSDTLQDVAYANTLKAWVCGGNGTIKRTVNGGVSWTSENSGITQGLNGIYSLDTITSWAVGKGGKIIKRLFGTGINEKQGFNQTQLKAFPNPFDSYITISFDEKILKTESAISIAVYDINGRIVKTVDEISSSEILLQKGNLANGAYTVKLLNKEKQILGSEKIIVN